MSNINDLISKKPTLILKYGVFFTLIYFLVVFIVLKNIKYNENLTFAYEYAGEDRVYVNMTIKEYNKINDNKCKVSFTHNNIEYEMELQITNKSYVNNKASLTFSNIQNYEYISVVKNGILKIENLDTTISDIIWMGVINNISF